VASVATGTSGSLGSNCAKTAARDVAMKYAGSTSEAAFVNMLGETGRAVNRAVTLHGIKVANDIDF